MEKKIHILVIDDDTFMRNMLEDMLTRVGYTVSLAADGAQGLKMFHRHQYDLVITDIIMPEKEGLELISDLRKSAKPFKVIAISGGGRFKGLDYLSLAEKLGAFKTLTKPFAMKEMLDAIKEALVTENKLPGSA